MGRVEGFVGVSVKVTGFDAGELAGSGMVEEYLGVVVRGLGDELYGRLVRALEGAEPGELGDGELVEAARAVAQLWYLGVWAGPGGRAPFVVSARAYEQGLVWRTFDGLAPGTVGADGGARW